MSELRIEEQTTYNPDFAADYDELLSSLHMRDSLHVPAEVRAVCEGTTSSLYLGLIDGRAAAMATIVKPTDSIGHRTVVFEDIAVQDAYKGQGLGSKMVEFMVAESARLGATRIELHSKDARQEAHALYRKFGFEIVNTRVFRRVLS
jgi:ribosomal protein S18 acetylase RimI-like enzyme